MKSTVPPVSYRGLKMHQLHEMNHAVPYERYPEAKVANIIRAICTPGEEYLKITWRGHPWTHMNVKHIEVTAAGYQLGIQYDDNGTMAEIYGCIEPFGAEYCRDIDGGSVSALLTEEEWEIFADLAEPLVQQGSNSVIEKKPTKTRKKAVKPIEFKVRRSRSK